MMSVSNVSDRLVQVLGASRICLAWDEDVMIPREACVGCIEAECKQPDAPTFAQFIDHKGVIATRIGHLFTLTQYSLRSEPGAEGLGGMPNDAPKSYWKALVYFLELENIWVFPAAGGVCDKEFAPLDRQQFTPALR